MAFIDSQIVTSGEYGTGPTILVSVSKRQALGGEVKRVNGYLFNASEGLQRSFKEKKMKLKRIEHVLFTSLCADRYLGLSGLVLGLGDVGSENLTVHGPTGMYEYVNACRPFFPRNWPKVHTIGDIPVESQPLIVHSDEFVDIVCITIGSIMSNKRRMARGLTPQRKRRRVEHTADPNIEGFPLDTPFLPPVNLYVCEFKNAATSSNNVDRTDSEKISRIAIVECCISVRCIQAVVEYFCLHHRDVSKFYHLFPPSQRNEKDADVESIAYYKSQWKRSFADPKCKHIFLDDAFLALNTDISPAREISSTINDSLVSFQARLHGLAPKNFRRPEFVNDSASRRRIFEKEVEYVHKQLALNDSILVPASDQLESTKSTQAKDSATLNQKVADVLRRSMKDKTCSNISNTTETSTSDPSPEITFLGTGSAAPSKLRNSSGIYLNMKNSFYGNLLIDVGEGTYGQLVRLYGQGMTRTLIKDLRVVWISHHHIDHHLGLLRILEARGASLNSEKDNGNLLLRNKPLLVIGPATVKNFLTRASPKLCQLYMYFSFDEFNSAYNVHEILNREMGISALINVPVYHCRESYGLILHLKSGEKIVYSGDTRPCKNLVNAGLNATLLIHEATFDDSMIEDAKKKRHSTVSEALKVASDMQAYAVILTHFSQRYPQIINGSTVDEKSSQAEENTLEPILAFDMMNILINDRDLSVARSATSHIIKFFGSLTDEESI